MGERNTVLKKMIGRIGAENAEQAIRIINGTTLPETDSRRHQMMVAHLEGEALSKLAEEQGLTGARGVQLFRTGFALVQKELAERDRPDRIIRTLYPMERDILKERGFHTDQEVFAASKSSRGALGNQVWEKFRLDLDENFRPGTVPELTTDQTDALLRLNGALEAIAWRDTRFDVRDLQIVLRAARSGTPLTAEQLAPLGSGEDITPRLNELSDETVTKRNWPPKGRMVPLAIKQSDPEWDGLIGYEITGEGKWIVGLLDRLLPDPEDRSGERALDALTDTGLSILEMSALLRISLAPLTRKIPTCLGPGYCLVLNSEDVTRRLQEKWLITPPENGRHGYGLMHYRVSMGGAALVEQMAEIIAPDRSLQIEERPDMGPEL